MYTSPKTANTKINTNEQQKQNTEILILIKTQKINIFTPSLDYLHLSKGDSPHGLEIPTLEPKILFSCKIRSAFIKITIPLANFEYPWILVCLHPVFIIFITKAANTPSTVPYIFLTATTR